MCVRLSTIHNRTGCGTWNEGMHAQLRYASNSTNLLNLIDEDPTDYPIAVVMSLSLLTTNTLNNLAQNLTAINGVIFLQDSDNDEMLKPPFNSDGYSSASPSPHWYLRPSSHSFNYLWNPYGSSDYLREYEFAMIVVSPAQSGHIKNVCFLCIWRLISILRYFEIPNFSDLENTEF